jgi:hypothetical protein
MLTIPVKKLPVLQVNQNKCRPNSIHTFCANTFTSEVYFLAGSTVEVTDYWHQTYIYTTNYSIILCLNTLEINRSHTSVEFTQIYLTLFVEM